jgi:type I restriction enzyme S subunit
VCISPGFQKSIREKSSSTTLPILNKSKFEALSIPLPPIAEQQRIVDKIEELFSDLDSGINSLKTAQQQLKVYRQAVLKWAFEGKLTAQWREEQQRQGKLESADTLLAQIKAEREQRYQKELEVWQAEVEAWEANGKEGKKPRKPSNFKIESLDEAKIAQLETLPKGWIWTRVDNLGDVQLGRQRAPKHHQGTHMRPYLRVANVFEDYIDTSDVLSMNFTPEEFRTYELHYGDILLNEGQSLELVGRSAIYKSEVPGACFQNTLVRFRPSKLMSSEFPQYVFLYYLHSGKFQKIAKWTTSGSFASNIAIT